MVGAAIRGSISLLQRGYRHEKFHARAGKTASLAAVLTAAQDLYGHGSRSMNHGVESSPSFDATASQWIHLVGVGIEIFGVLIIVAGIIWSSRFIYRREIRSRYDNYKISIGRSLLPGLEVLVAA